MPTISLVQLYTYPSAAAAAIYVIYKLIKFLYQEWTSPLCTLPGPTGTSFIYGNLRDISNADNPALHEEWVAQYGSTMSCTGLIGSRRLYTTDPKALNHVLMNNLVYKKNEVTRYMLTRILGPGLLSVEGHKHKQQRRIMNPAFGAAQSRGMTDIFLEKSIQLRDIWALDSTKEGPDGRIEVMSWLNKTALDIIGMAGFNYNFDALTSEGATNELHQAFSTIFQASTATRLILVVRATIPALRFLPDERKAEAAHAMKTMNRIGNQLLGESKASILADTKDAGNIEKTSWLRRDLLSLLVRANMSTDLPPIQRLTDEDVLAFPTFLVAGHETASTAAVWALYALTQSPEVQTKLRQELLSVETDRPTMDELNGLPYFDAVVRETLCVHAPVPATFRVAVKDDVLPLGEPVKDKNGRMLDTIRIRKGQTIVIPILAMNRLKSFWGDDALKFKPERWESVPKGAAAVPGVWGNMMTFLGGPQACIGYRFALVELKCLLFTLVRAFEFELAVPPKDIITKTSITQCPVLRSDPKQGNVMPLIVKSYQG